MRLVGNDDATRRLEVDYVTPVCSKHTNNPALTFIVKELAAYPRWVEVSINANGVNGGARLFYLETQSEDLANHILMFSYLKARSLEVGEDQAREEFQSLMQEGFEKAERDKKKNIVNGTRTKTVKNP